MAVGVVDVLNSGCHSVKLLGVDTDCNKVNVNVEKKQGGCHMQICTAMIYTVCVMVIIDRTDLPVQFNYSDFVCP